MEEKRIEWHDSMGGNTKPILNALFQWLKDEHLSKKGCKLPDVDEWRLLICSKHTTPQQENSESWLSYERISMYWFDTFASRSWLWSVCLHDSRFPLYWPPAPIQPRLYWVLQEAHCHLNNEVMCHVASMLINISFQSRVMLRILLFLVQCSAILLFLSRST